MEILKPRGTLRMTDTEWTAVKAAQKPREDVMGQPESSNSCLRRLIALGLNLNEVVERNG